MIKQNLEPGTQKNGRITFSTENWGIVIAAFALFLILSIFCPGFFTDSNLLNILRESAFIGISAIALTFCIAAGFIDLSIGGMTALIAAITALTFNQFGFSAIAIGIGAGLLFGLVNGNLVVFCRIASFIATMSTMLIYRAAVYIMLDEQAVIIQNKTFTQLGNGSLAGGNTNSICSHDCMRDIGLCDSQEYAIWEKSSCDWELATCKPGRRH